MRSLSADLNLVRSAAELSNTKRAASSRDSLLYRFVILNISQCNKLRLSMYSRKGHSPDPRKGGGWRFRPYEDGTQGAAITIPELFPSSGREGAQNEQNGYNRASAT